MQNHISLRPNPVVTSYLKHFQIAQVNLSLFLKEQPQLKKRIRFFKEQNRRHA